MRRLLPLLSCALLLGCTTPYPNDTPIRGARVSANPYEPGSDAFCRNYARQTAGNRYEDRIDRGEDGFGVRAIAAQRAQADGAAAYRRCLDGRLN